MLAVDAHATARAGDEQQVASGALDELLEPAVEADCVGRLAGDRGGARPVLVQLADQPVDVLGFVHRVDAENTLAASRSLRRERYPARCQSVWGALFSKIQPRKRRP